jgi:A/G-specific adenine glycosylase
MMSWYRANGRHDLPWRRTRDPYAVLVSEVMLQQTQVERVVPYYEHWLERWPTVVALAAASPADVIREWAGLGYNRRALALQQAARTSAEQHGGRLPASVAGLETLPGVGPYTARAVACFGGGAMTTVADTNIARLLTRALLGREHPREAGPGALAGAAESLLPQRGARHHNLALMDLGAMICTAGTPACARCPWHGSCAWLAAGAPPAAVTSKTRAPRFESTARFARGRIVDALRGSAALTAEAIAEALPAEHRAKTGAYLAALARDGLACERDGLWLLPQGSSSMASPKL